MVNKICIMLQACDLVSTLGDWPSSWRIGATGPSDAPPLPPAPDVSTGWRVQENGEPTRLGGLRCMSAALRMRTGVALHLFISVMARKEA